MQLVEDYRVQDQRYASQKYDCDNFAIGFMADIARAWAEVSNGFEALAFGYVDGHNSEGVCHAWIWVRCPGGEYKWIEPQTNKLLVGKPQSFRTFEA